MMSSGITTTTGLDDNDNTNNDWCLGETETGPVSHISEERDEEQDPSASLSSPPDNSYRLSASWGTSRMSTVPPSNNEPVPPLHDELLQLFESQPLDLSQLPLPLEMIPNHVNSLKECARHQIQCLLEREQQQASTNSTTTTTTPMTLEEEDAIDDGFVLCDLNVIRNKLFAWRRLFPKIKPFFALKCNPDPMVAAVLGQLGAGFDCASVPEIYLALSSTCHQPSSIVYANPQRAEKDLETALQNGVLTLTFDGPEELHKVHRAYQKLVRKQERDNATTAAMLPLLPPQPPDMVLRILVPDKHSTVPLGEKFGVPPSQIESLAELAAQLGLPIIGISFHCGSGNHDPDAYKVAVELASDAAKTVEQVFAKRGILNQRCWLLDIGGGYPGFDGVGGDAGRFVGNNYHVVDIREQEEGETARKIAEAVAPVLDQLYPTPTTAHDDDEHNKIENGDSSSSSSYKPVQFIAEPGRYFVEAAFALCSRIYRVQVEESSSSSPNQQQQHRHYYIAQGVQGMFKDCILCGESFLPIPYAMDEAREALDAVPCTIHGPSGDDYDVVCRDFLLPPLEVGDWLLFDRMGAYTLSIAARSGRPSIRYVMGASSLPPLK